MYNLTHFPGPLVCQIRQVLTSAGAAEILVDVLFIAFSDNPNLQKKQTEMHGQNNI